MPPPSATGSAATNRQNFVCTRGDSPHKFSRTAARSEATTRPRPPAVSGDLHTIHSLPADRTADARDADLGILRSQSRGPDSLWVRVGGEGFETKVVDGWRRTRFR